MRNRDTTRTRPRASIGQSEQLERRVLLAAELVRDINITPSTEVAPVDLVGVGDLLFFIVTDSRKTRDELWKCDGTEAGTVLLKTIAPSTYSSAPSHYLTDVNGTLFFVTNDGVSGYELWKSDGTTAGTVLVKDIYPGQSGSSPRHLTRVGTTLFFTAFDAEKGFALWKSDGSESGTVLVKDIESFDYGSVLRNLTDVNDLIFLGRRLHDRRGVVEE